MVKRLDETLRALELHLRSPAALRLRVRLARYQNALLGALIGLGILLMVVHWAGSAQPRAPHAAPLPTDGGPHQTLSQP
jgi:hypothetical protein